MRRTVLVVVLLVAALGHAAPPPAADPAADRARTVLMLHLVDALDLPEEQAMALRAVFREADEQRGRLAALRDAALHALREALAKKPVDAAALPALVDQVADLDRQLAAIPEETFRRARGLLTVEQQARLLVLRGDLQGRVREAMRQRMHHAPAAHRPTHP